MWPRPASTVRLSYKGRTLEKWTRTKATLNSSRFVFGPEHMRRAREEESLLRAKSSIFDRTRPSVMSPRGAHSSSRIRTTTPQLRHVAPQTREPRHIAAPGPLSILLPRSLGAACVCSPNVTHRELWTRGPECVHAAARRHSNERCRSSRRRSRRSHRGRFGGGAPANAGELRAL